MEFEAFPKIERFKGLRLVITQKIHGSNAQVYIYPVQENQYWDENKQEHIVTDGAVLIDGVFYKLACGSRNRWVTPDTDNFGFATFVYANMEEFIRKLGPGRHYGEWAGPGINSGEGLVEKKFVLFDYWKFPPERQLPPGCVVVPVLYDEICELNQINMAMGQLKTHGSFLIPGYMKPEGIVITLNGTRFKKVFAPEEVAWQNQKKPKVDSDEKPDYGYLLQPMRLEKLLSRDEKYINGYPTTLGMLTKDYIADLKEEGFLDGAGDLINGEIVLYKPIDTKELSRQVFPFVRSIMENL